MSGNRFLPTLLVALLISISASACRKTKVPVSPAVLKPDTLVAGTFITAPGEFTHMERRAPCKLHVRQNPTSLSLELRRRIEGQTGASAYPASRSSISETPPSAPWFIFVETLQDFWVFNGVSSLHFFHPDQPGSSPVIVAGKINPSPSFAKVPAEVVLRLPAALQKLFPPLKPAGNRPSL
jgi:hypothetical protein